jgi:hypothetical protein
LALRELNLFPNRVSNNLDETSLTDEELIEAANAMNIQSTSHGITQFSFPSAIPIKISQINRDTFFDIVLQVSNQQKNLIYIFHLIIFSN